MTSQVHRSVRSRSADILVAAALVAVMAGCGDSPDAMPPETTTNDPSVRATELRVGEHDGLRIDLPSPDWLAVDSDHLFVKSGSGTVERVDPASGAVVGSAEITGEGGLSGGGCQGIGVGFDSVWSCHGTDVVRIGLDPFEEVSRIPAGKAASQGHLATGFDRVWVLQGDGSAVVGIDPQTEQLDEPIALPVRGTDLAVGDDALWIVSSLDDAVVVMDPVDGAVRHRIDVNGAAVLAVADEAAWVGGSDAVHRIDQTSGTITLTIEGGPGSLGALAAADTGIWVRRGNEVRYVGVSGDETETFTLDLSERSPGDMLVGFGALWTTGSEDAALFRIALTEL